MADENAEAIPTGIGLATTCVRWTSVATGEEQNEGTTLRIRNNEEERKNPADLEMFDSFVFGSKLITEDNYMMTLQIRTHSADEAAPVYYGVQVVDLTATDPRLRWWVMSEPMPRKITLLFR